MAAVLVPQKGATSMTIFVMVRVGSRYETKPVNGASHFVEHLMFKGTKRRPTTKILTQTIERFGAEFNAYTGKDLTAYYMKMAAERTPLAIDMLHDMLFHSLYDPKEIDRERGVILEEINMYEDNPRMHLEEILEQAIFPDSTLGWSTLGPRGIIRNISREQLIAYRDAYYIPSRMTVVVAGKIVPGVMAMLNKTFGRVPEPKEAHDHPFAPFCPPIKLAKPIEHQNKQTEQVQLALGFHGLHLKDKDVPAATLLGVILGGTMSSRLFIEIRERRGLCYSIRAGHEPLEDTGVFTVTAGLDRKRMKEATAAILHELKKTTRTVVDADELRRAKDNLRGRSALSFEDSAAQAEWFGRQWTFLKRLETPEDKLRRIDAVTAADIRRVARAIFRPEHMATAVIGPFGEKAIRSMLKW
jgi:predicted Zn-dependent peptidase